MSCRAILFGMHISEQALCCCARAHRGDSSACMHIPVFFSLCSPMTCSGCPQVVDETDRMLRQSYQDWLQHLTTAVAAQKRPGHERVVKVVASATLTRDPSKLERLGLHCPRYIAMTSQDHRHESSSFTSLLVWHVRILGSPV